MTNNSQSLPLVSWKLIRPDADNGAVPCARSSHGLSWVHQRLVLIGGEHVARTPLEPDQAYWAADYHPSTNTWKWRRMAFADNDDSRPSPRIAHAQAADHETQQVYIFGGRAGITMAEQAMNDLWRLDCSGSPGSETWTRVETSGPVPEARSFHRMICIGSKLYVFGGCGASGRLADLHEFDIASSIWKSLGTTKLRGRGGPNLIPWNPDRIAIVAGFAGEETCDGQVVDLKQNEDLSAGANMLDYSAQMRPRSVCVSASFLPDYVVIFGGEVDPSDLGHEGAGSFENDLVLLDPTYGHYVGRVAAPKDTSSWPPARGWSDGSIVPSHDNDKLVGGQGMIGNLFVFGGLAGDDKNPLRLDDLWLMSLQKPQ